MDFDLGKDPIRAADLAVALRNLAETTPEGLAIHEVRIVPGLDRGENMKCQVEWHLLVAFRPEGVYPNEPEAKGFQMGIFRIDRLIKGGTLLPEKVSGRWLLSQFHSIKTREDFFTACYGLAEK